MAELANALAELNAHERAFRTALTLARGGGSGGGSGGGGDTAENGRLQATATEIT